jgi:hypothetical protein
MTATKSKYWGIFNNDGLVFEGTFKECWDELLKRYHNLTVGQLELANVRIQRSK